MGESVRIGLALILGLIAAPAFAQRPPPPTVVVPTEPRPRLLNNKLDKSFCKYPTAAIRQGVQGCCRMKVEVTAKGKAGKMTGNCTHEVFRETSVACLTPQAFIPARKSGRAVKGMGEVVVEYRFEKYEPPPMIRFLEGLFPTLKRPEQKTDDDDICKPRPDDLIAALERLAGG
jgi:hypothetical protein